MLVPTPDCEANKGTGAEAKKRKKELVCDGDDELEPSLKQTARQLRRKPSSCTELEEGTGSKTTVSRIARFSDHELEEGTGMCKLEEGTANTSSSSRFSISKTKTTVSRTARFSDHETQSKEGLKSTNMNIFETKNKLGDYMKVKLMRKYVELIKESENEIKRAGGGKMDKYQVS